jgi:hypothetical protein
METNEISNFKNHSLEWIDAMIRTIEILNNRIEALEKKVNQIDSINLLKSIKPWESIFVVDNTWRTLTQDEMVGIVTQQVMNSIAQKFEV